MIVREFDGEGFALDSIRFWSPVFAALMLTASAGQGHAEVIAKKKIAMCFKKNENRRVVSQLSHGLWRLVLLSCGGSCEHADPRFPL